MTALISKPNITTLFSLSTSGMAELWFGCFEYYHFKGQGHYDKVKGQIKVTPWYCTPTTPNQCPYQVSTSYTLQFLRYRPDKIL